MQLTRTATRSLGPAMMQSLLALLAALALMTQLARAEAGDFVGIYTGSAEVQSSDGTVIPRDMSVEISQTSDGFRVQWTSISYFSDGETRENSYEIAFVPSDRPAVFAAAQRKNVFGHEVQLDPMKGEPYVWARIEGATMTVYSLFVDEDGGYSLQQYERTLAEGGLDLRFQVIRDGEILRAVETFLTRQ